MGKRILLVLMTLIATAAAANAEILFRGVLQIGDVTSGCANIRSKGDLNNAQFHPRGLGNANFTALTVIWDFGGHSYRVEGVNLSTSYTNMITEGLGWSVYQADANAAILLNPVPSITNTTAALSLSGKIRNPNGNVGENTCEASFVASLYKVVE